VNFSTTTCSPPDFSGIFPVNNSSAKAVISLEFIGVFNLFTVCSRQVFGEQPVHINWWAEIKFLLDCFQFIERTKRAAASKIEAVRFRIIPGDWGKAGSGWLTRLL
jgi:hypothetical protein